MPRLPGERLAPIIDYRPPQPIPPLKWRFAWWLLIVHTAVVLFVLSLALSPSQNADSSLAFILMVVFMYLVDFPVGVLVELLDFAGWGRMGTWLIVGGMQWLLIGLFIDWCIRAYSMRKQL